MTTLRDTELDTFTDFLLKAARFFQEHFVLPVIAEEHREATIRELDWNPEGDA